MSRNISRRSLLAGAGQVAAASAVGQMLAAMARAQEAAPAQAPASAGLCMTMTFLQGQKAKINRDDYAKKHLPMLREVYGDSVERIELRTASGSAMGGIPSPVLATSTIWIRDAAGFSQKLGANAARINKELDEIVQANRDVQIDRVALALGDARGDVPANSHVFSLYYPAAAPAFGGMGMGGPGRGGRGPGGGAPAGGGGATAGAGAAPGGAAPGDAPAGPRFDAAYFVDVFLPKLYSLFGSNIVRRLEGTLGQPQGAQKPTYLGAYHIVIRDRGAYDGKSMSVFTDLQKDSGQFTSVFPTMADLRVTAIA